MNNNKNKNKNRVRRIGVDARFFGLENKGLGRYTNELVEWLDKLIQSASRDESQKCEYYIFLRDNNFNEYQPISNNIHKVKADYQWYSWQEQVLFPFLLNRYNLDIVHFTHFNVPILYRVLGVFVGKNKFIVTIHDLILFRYPTIKNTTLNKFLYFFKLAVYHAVIRIVVRQAELIIAISNFTKKDIMEALKVSEEKIEVIYEGAEFSKYTINKKDATSFLTKNDGKIFKKYGIMKEYLLYVGNAYPHKNLERLVLAFNKLKNKNKLQLVLIGKKDYFYEELERFIKGRQIKNIVITDYVSDEDLDIFYAHAKMFIFPSLYEGFGLPPLEALVRSLPVISSSRSSLKEILEDNVRYFDVENVDLMAMEMNHCLLDGVTIPTKKIIKEIKNKYSWKDMTKSIINIYLKW